MGDYDYRSEEYKAALKKIFGSEAKERAFYEGIERRAAERAEKQAKEDAKPCNKAKARVRAWSQREFGPW